MLAVPNARVGQNDSLAIAVPYKVKNRLFAARE